MNRHSANGVHPPKEDRPRHWSRDWAMWASVAISIALFSVIVTRALTSDVPHDIGLAYTGGEEAWRTGRPENVPTWVSTPFLGMLLAMTSRVMSLGTTMTAFTLLNVLIAVVTAGTVWWRLRRELPRGVWLIVLPALSTWAPLASTIWWKQFNLYALALAVAAVALARRGRHASSGLCGALSLAVKPIIILLPLAFLARRDTRRTGVWMLGWGSLLLLISQLFMAWRAGTMAALSPIPMLRVFADRSAPANGWVCSPENFAPHSMLCRLVGGEYWEVQRLVLGVAFVVLVTMFASALRPHAGTSWNRFAVVCLLSPMFGPFAWSHYQVLLAPTFLVLLVWLFRDGTSYGPWVGYIAAYALTQLVWQPYGTVYRLTNLSVEEPIGIKVGVFTVAMFAQYLLAMVAYGRLTAHVGHGDGRRQPPATAAREKRWGKKPAVPEQPPTCRPTTALGPSPLGRAATD